MRRLGLIFICYAILAGPASVQARLFWLEGWEGSSRDITSQGRWDSTSCPGTWPNDTALGVSQDRAFAGTHSLKFHYTGTQYDPGGNHECASSREFPWSDEIWLTWYENMAAG